MNRVCGSRPGPRFAALLSVLLLFGGLKLARGAADRAFSIPVDVLKLWSDNIVISMDVRITGHSGVHPLQGDCEMHFGGRSDSFRGDPPGLVLEPMSLCVQPFFGKTTLVKKDWLTFGKALVGTTVKVRGVPRIWPEHLIGKQSDSNPHHAVELHPLTMLKQGTVERDFSSFIFDPEEYEGGLKPESAIRILSKTTVSVVNNVGMAQITFDSGQIGNFTFLHFTILKDSIEDVPGGHRMNGEVEGEAAGKIHVRLVSVEGSAVDSAIAKLKTRTGQLFGMDALVLLSLSPEALHKAATASGGASVVVDQPFQLIVYGEEDAQD